MIIERVPRNGQKTALLVGCAFVGAYVIYQIWKKRQLRTIDEGFVEIAKIEDTHERRVLVLGLDEAGKTSVLDQICMIDRSNSSYIAPPYPTRSFQYYRLRHESYVYSIYELGGAEDNREYWSNFLQDTDLLVFVVDASDPDKLSLAVSTLKQLLGDSRMDTVPILVVANKQDQPNAMTIQQVKEALDLYSISPHKHKVEIIGCQTRPLPLMPKNCTEYTWHHQSVEAVRTKMFSMAISC